jgi:hypothetical protein
LSGLGGSALQAQEGQVRAGVAPRKVGAELSPIEQGDAEVFIALNDVVGGEHQVGGVGDASGRQSAAGVDSDRGLAGVFGGICQSIGEFYQYISHLDSFSGSIVHGARMRIRRMAGCETGRIGGTKIHRVGGVW